jgi:diguanylate cyclase (GGDEF)-like protein
MAGTDKIAPGSSTGVTRVLLRVVTDDAGPDGVDRVLVRAGLSNRREQLLSADERISYPEKLRLFDAAAEVLADPRIGLRLGAASLHDDALEPWRRLAREQGSPAAAFRGVSPFSTRFDSATLLACHRADDGSASLSWQVLPPYQPNRVDCDAQMSFLAQVPVLFGLPRARVAHGDACQVTGDTECRYEVTWTVPPLQRLCGLLRKPAPNKELPDRGAMAEHRLRTLEGAAADLASMESLEEILDKILDRTDSAVHAPGHLLAVRTPAGGRHVRTRGLGDVLAAALNANGTALSPDSSVLDGLPVMSAPIQSAKHFYGVLAAVAHAGQEFFPNDAEALASYARHAAVSLDIAGVVAKAREHGETAHLLLSVSNSLAEHSTVPALASSLADAVPALSGADRSAIALLDPEAGRLKIAGMSGWHGELAERLASYIVDAQDSPELTHMLANRSPLLVDTGGSDWAQGMLEEFKISALAAVPIMTGDQLTGIVLAHWVGPGPASLAGALTDRLSGLAALAAVAMERIGLLEHARRQALHDPLTELPNRALLEDRLESSLAQSGRNGSQVGLLFCDVNRFKRINDGLGHGAGDAVLRHIAAQLRAAVPDSGTVARYSGDEFVVLLPDLNTPSEVDQVASRIRSSLAEPIEIDGKQIVLDVAIGSTLGRVSPGDEAASHAESGRLLVAKADLEMYRAKARARGQALPVVRRRHDLQLEADLRGAASRGELSVQFQPQIDMATRSVVAAEALVRWEHPELGLLTPGEFIPLAEDSNLITEVGAHVLSTACVAGAGWRAAGHSIEIAVNVSSVQLSDPRFPAFVQDTLTRSTFPATALTLEITESQAMTDSSVNDSNLRELRDLGVGISIDDFGTGYSSLAQLHRLPVTEVKIDRSFTTRLGEDGSDAFIAGIIGLAHGLGLLVVAEGVETADHLAALAKVGCDRAQGFLLGKPMDAPELEKILEVSPAAPTTQQTPDATANSVLWTLMSDANEARQLVHQAVEKAGYRVEPSEWPELRVHVPRSIRRRRRPAWLTGAAKVTEGRTDIKWTSDDGRVELNELLLEVEEGLPAGVMYYHGLTDAATRAGLTFSGKQAVRRIVDLLDSHDVVRAVGKGQLNDDPGFVVLTDNRLIVQPNGADVSPGATNLALHSIDSILLGKRSSGETLTVTLLGRVLEISRLGHGEGHGIAKTFREIAAERNRTVNLSAAEGEAGV